MWQKFLRRMGFVRYQDFMECRDALAKVAQGFEDDAWVMRRLDNATIICDYPDVVIHHYPDYD